MAPRKSSRAQLGDGLGERHRRRGPTARRSRRCRASRRRPAASRPDSEWATGWPMRTTRLVMLAPFRGRRRSPDRRWPREPGRPIVGLAGRDEAGDREGHRQAMVVEAVGRRPAERRAAVDAEVVARRPRSARPARAGPRRSRRSGPIPCGAARPRHGSRSCRGRPSRPGRGSGSRRWPRPRRPARARRRAASDDRTTRSAIGSPTPSSGPARCGRSSMSAPIERRMSITARRVGLTPTSAERELGVGMDRAGDQPERRRRDVARDPFRRPSATDTPPSTVHGDAPIRRILALDRHAPRPQHPLRVVARGDRLADRRPPIRSQPGQQDRRLHLRARHRRRGSRSTGAGYDRPRSVVGGSRSVGRGAPRPSSAVAR